MKPLKSTILFFLIIIPVFGFGQNEPLNTAEELSKEPFMCDSDTLELILPSNWESTRIFQYEEGFIKTYNYLDNSSLSILCGSNAFLSTANDSLNSRKISVNGREITYNHVPDERLNQFNSAFDQMVANQKELQKKD